MIYSPPPPSHPPILPSSHPPIHPQVQVFNRDLSTLVLSLFAEQFAAEKAQKKRRLKPTWDTWTKPEPPPAAAAAGGEGKEGGESKEEVIGSAPVGSVKGIKVLEALSATGLRSLRYIKEVPGIESIIANDLQEAAVETITRNVAFNVEKNGVGEGRVTPNQGDACMVMYQHREVGNQFDVVDLDPYVRVEVMGETWGREGGGH
jgi:tRNA (guanine26-N2/guanine27-N2)-dimethyltransferase